ncbi:MAG: hypothetical protein EPN74_15350 [Rhodanobacter sp.]|nr:MAG: hypothetical protein EPN74_15350 [Rhodanobacter sp.]
MPLRLVFFALLATGLLAGCGNGSMMSDFGSTSIANGGIRVKHGVVTLHVSDAPNAVISANGELRVDGKVVATTSAQQALLKRYATAALAVREHGIATGKAGAAVAGAAIRGIAASIASGDSDQIDKHVDAKAKQVDTEANKICVDIANLKATQNALAIDLPAFRPYAGIIHADAGTDCKDDSAH